MSETRQAKRTPRWVVRDETRTARGEVTYLPGPSFGVYSESRDAAGMVLRQVAGEIESRAHAVAISLAPRMVDALRDALPMLEELENWEWGNGGAEVLPEAGEVRAILREIDEED